MVVGWSRLLHPQPQQRAMLRWRPRRGETPTATAPFAQPPCRRRRCWGSAWGSQATRPAHRGSAAPARLGHSAAVAALPVAAAPAAPCTGAQAATKAAYKAGAKGSNGGATAGPGRYGLRQRGLQPVRQAWRLGLAGCSTSVSAPMGQPPPGNCASSALCPVGWVGPKRHRTTGGPATPLANAGAFGWRIAQGAQKTRH